MKSSVRPQQNIPPEGPQYPQLRRGTVTGVIVLFTGVSTGTVVHLGTSQYHLGERSTTWGPRFTKYHGSVTLSND